MTQDTRIVFGARCLWWDDINKVDSTPLTNGIATPCCPHCGGVLMEVSTLEVWWRAIDTYEADGHPGYRFFVEWLRGKCFPNRKTAKEEYESKSGKKVVL